MTWAPRDKSAIPPDWRPGYAQNPKPAVNHPATNVKLPAPGSRPRERVQAVRPTCTACTWALVGGVWTLKFVCGNPIMGGCELHAPLAAPWDHAAWLAGT